MNVMVMESAKWAIASVLITLLEKIAASLPNKSNFQKIIPIRYNRQGNNSFILFFLK